MDLSQIYIIVAIVVLAIIAFFAFFLNKTKKNKKLTPFAGLAFAFILAGIVFRENIRMGYYLIGAGVVLAIIDIVMKFRKKN
jgi:hypothetical protein